MGAVFQLCHFKSKKTQTAPNCLLPRELSTPQKPSSGQQWFDATKEGIREVSDATLRAADTEIALPIAELFRQLQQR